MKNKHLIPPSVIDIVDKYNSPLAQQNEKMNYILRLEAIRDFCEEVLKKNDQQNFLYVKKKNYR